MTLEVITQTALRTFRKCQRNYNLGYVQLYRSARVADPLFFGTLWHEVREAWWRAEKGPTRLVMALDRFRRLIAEEAAKENAEQLNPFIQAKLLVMLRGYHERWCNYVDNVEILGVETPYEITLRNPRTGMASRLYKIQGKIDAIIRENGAIWVVEEKTAAEDLKPESPYWRKLEMDPQCSLYYNAVWEMYKERPAGIKYFVNVKPSYKPLQKSENIKYKKDGSGPYAGQRLEDETHGEFAVRIAEKVAESPERFYQMVEVARLERDIIESQIDVWDTAQAIRRATLTSTWLRNPDACIHPFGSSCNFLPVCSNRASLDDKSMYRKADTAHEELEEKSV